MHYIAAIAARNSVWPSCVLMHMLVNAALIYNGALFCISLYISLYTRSFLAAFFACSPCSVVQSCWFPAGFLFFSLPGLLCTHQAGHPGWGGGVCWMPVLVCRPSCTTLGPDLSALPRLWAQTHNTSSLLLALPLCSHCHPSTAHNPRACWEN